MKKLWVLAISAIFGVSMFFAYAMPAMADEDMPSLGATCPFPSFTGPSHDSGYLGAMAVDREYNELGRVIEVMSGSEGTVNFLIVSSCLPGMGDKFVAIPVREFDIHESVGTVVTGITQEEFEKAPAISGKEWNDLGFRWSRWIQDDYKYFEKTL